MFLKFISPTVFLVSLAVGLLFVYLSNPPLDVILVYPTPDNLGRVQYKDKAGACFEFQAAEVACPEDGSAKTIPVQI